MPQATQPLWGVAAPSSSKVTKPATLPQAILLTSVEHKKGKGVETGQRIAFKTQKVRNNHP